MSAGLLGANFGGIMPVFGWIYNWQCYSLPTSLIGIGLGNLLEIGMLHGQLTLITLAIYKGAMKPCTE